MTVECEHESMVVCLTGGLNGVEETSSGVGPAVGLVLLLLIALLVVVQMCKNEQRVSVTVL